MQLHPYNVAQKTEVIVEHFRGNVRHHMDGRAKAMVVTSGRLHAVLHAGLPALHRREGV